MQTNVCNHGGMKRLPRGEARERVWRFVAERVREGRPPTVREVQRALGFRAVQSAARHLQGLVAEGRLVQESGRSRGYRLPDHRPPVRVPVLGRVPAGPWQTAAEDLMGYLSFQSRRGTGDLFALRVQGDSMIGAGILDGDLVVVRRQAVADPGDIVVARVGDEATVKRLRLVEGRPELWPENPRYSVLRPDPEDLVLLGKVIEVRRLLEEGVLDPPEA
ncbi:MAG TPA: transcriptional repressor LexA [Myxococcota bacterium]|nr:transcriptional repressor LexA [Myxococcota bacterium]HQK52534.1 transcriptional repressor LexA [Myxococcota bacterium]